MVVDERANDTTVHESGVAHPREEGPTTRINMGKGERIASILGGAALALAAVAKRGRVGLGLAMAAGSLLVRGVTGSSLLMRLLGKNRALVSPTGAAAVPHEQGIRVEDSILIERSAGELYHSGATSPTCRNSCPTSNRSKFTRAIARTGRLRDRRAPACSGTPR